MVIKKCYMGREKGVETMLSLSAQERKEIELISLFRRAGYKRCRLGQFDEYELFDQNRAFLEGDKMLTFTDPYGKLYALRPDVTLSVMKQAAYQPDPVYKVYYKENVFRLSSDTHQYEAHAQFGAEAIEKEAASDGSEVLALAQQALACLGDRTVLVLSHMGFLLNNEWYIKQSSEIRDQILLYIAQKNRHDLKTFLEGAGCPLQEQKKLTAAPVLTGRPEKVLEIIKKEQLGQELQSAAEEVCAQVSQLSELPGQKVILDFSLVNPLSYYNGLVFQGFLQGCSSYVLSGGRYDHLAKRFFPSAQKSCGAIGFAIDLEALEPVWKRKEESIC